MVSQCEWCVVRGPFSCGNGWMRPIRRCLRLGKEALFSAGVLVLGSGVLAPNGIYGRLHKCQDLGLGSELVCIAWRFHCESDGPDVISSTKARHVLDFPCFSFSGVSRVMAQVLSIWIKHTLLE